MPCQNIIGFFTSLGLRHLTKWHWLILNYVQRSLIYSLKLHPRVFFSTFFSPSPGSIPSNSILILSRVSNILNISTNSLLLLAKIHAFISGGIASRFFSTKLSVVYSISFAVCLIMNIFSTNFFLRVTLYRQGCLEKNIAL